MRSLGKESENIIVKSLAKDLLTWEIMEHNPSVKHLGTILLTI